MQRTRSRKADHVKICLDEAVETCGSGFDCVRLIHRALPGIDRDEVDMSCEVLGKELSFPLMISAMTGGYPGASEINLKLARAAQEAGIGLGLGSMRAMIEDETLGETYAVRDVAPDILLVGNIGLPQLTGLGSTRILEAMESIDVDAIAVHLNALQEATQPEGETSFSNDLASIKDFASQSKRPVVVKETGAGISKEDALGIRNAGIEWVDVGGYGGTNFAVVESHRAEDGLKKELADSLGSWGIPTAASLVEVSSSAEVNVIASGGIRDGLEVAKSIALGARCAGMASPMLKAVVEGHSRLESLIELVRVQFLAAMFLTGSRTVGELARANVIIGGWLRDWIVDRGLEPERFSGRE